MTMTTRKWEDLETDCLAKVFEKIDLSSLIFVVLSVCKSWYRTSLLPDCWKVLDFRKLEEELFYPYEDELFYNNKRITFTEIIKYGVDHSCGAAVKVVLPKRATIEDLDYISARCPGSKILSSTSSLIRRIQIQDSIIRKMLTENSLATNPYTPARTNNQLLINRPVGSVVNNAGLPGSTRFCRSGLLGGGGGGGSMDLGLGIEYNKLDYMRLEDLKGKIAALAKVQHGCKFLQDKIDEGRYEDVNTIFDEVKEFMSELMVNQFGNYMVQKLFELLNEQQLNEILYSITTKTDYVLAKICQNIHGFVKVTRWLQGTQVPVCKTIPYRRI